MTITEEALHDQYAALYAKRKQQMAATFTANPGKSPEELAGTMAKNYGIVMSNGEKQTLSAAFDGLKRDNATVAEAYCNSHATERMSKTVLAAEKHAAHGKTHSSEAVGSFSSKMKKECEERIGTHTEAIAACDGKMAACADQKEKERLAKSRADHEKALAQYKKQLEVWSESSKRQLTLEHSNGQSSDQKKQQTQKR